MLIIIVVAAAASAVFVPIAFVAFSVVFFSQLLLFLLLSCAYFDCSTKKLSGRLGESFQFSTCFSHFHSVVLSQCCL